ncbi:MAG: DUF4214 domain-containing protein [Acidimicrobiales bacterium]|nr:DUF4214 domain-containing protein [Acidimicrobiales bacterium]
MTFLSQRRSVRATFATFALLISSVAAFLPGPAQALSDQTGSDTDEIRITEQTTALDHSVTPDDELIALAAGADTDGDDEHVDDHPILAKSTPLPSTAVALDGVSEMVIVQPLGADGNPVVHTQMAIRSGDEDGWSEWALLHSDGEEGPDGLPGGEGSGSAAAEGAGAVGPIWVGEGAKHVEVVLMDGDVSAVRVEALDAPGASSSLISSPSASAKVAATWGAQPTIHSNSEWGSPGYQRQNSGCEDGPRYTNSLRAMVVHHTVTTNNYSQAEVPKLLQGIHRFHTGTRGWCDVAYNFLVDKFGTLWEGRSGGIASPVIGGHSRGFNDNTFAVALLGQHQSNVKSPAPARPSSAQLQAVQALGAWKLRLHGVDPNGTTLLKNTAIGGVLKHPSSEYVKVPTIMGHRDLGVTSCPGNWTMPVVSDMKAKFTPLHAGSPPYAQDGIVGDDFGPKLLAADVWGGLRPALGQAAPTNPPAAAPAIAIGGTATAGYVLASNGTLRPYGDAPAVGGQPGGANPVDLIVRDSGKSGYVVTADGYLHGFGGQVQDRSSRGSGVVAGDVNDAKVGYTVNSAGTLFPVFNTPAGSLRVRPVGNVIDIVVWPSGTSGYVLTHIGEVIGFGSATSFGDVVPSRPTAVVAGPNLNGGWVVDTEGRWWTFGDERPVVSSTTNIGTNAIVDAVLTGYDLTGTSFLQGSDARYIDAVFRNLLGRAPGTNELDHWRWKTDFRGTTALGSAMVRTSGFTDSTVADMYASALGRPGDAKGLAYWSNLLNTGQLSIRDMGVYFYGSRELFQRSGGAEGYVDKLYASLLHRSPDASGRAYWAGLLTSGKATPSQVTAGFYDSIESRRDRATRLYTRVAGAAPSEADRENWAGMLLKTDDLTVAANMIASPSYYRLVT